MTTRQFRKYKNLVLSTELINVNWPPYRDSNLCTVANLHLSTPLIKPNFCILLPHRSSTTVSLETTPSFSFENNLSEQYQKMRRGDKKNIAKKIQHIYFMAPFNMSITVTSRQFLKIFVGKSLDKVERTSLCKGRALLL